MANMNDYLSWRGDVTLAERPFNDVDALIFSSLSYIDFTPVMPTPDVALPLADAAAALLDVAGDDFGPYVRSFATLDATFLRLLGESARFGQGVVRNVRDVMSPERTVQFAALEVELPGDLTFVSFRGTDSSLVGWREDFMLSFTITDAQRMAAEYLENALLNAQKRGRRVMVGGHSKGGNLCSYAVAACRKDLLPLIEGSYSFDGPGVDEELVLQGAYDLLGARHHRIQPSYSVIGALFDREGEPRRFVASAASGMLQHDPMTWETTAQGLVDVDEQAPDAALIVNALDDWLSQVPLEERAAFTNELFDILASGGASTLADVFQMPGVQQVLQAAGGASETVKSLTTRLIEIAWEKTKSAMKSAAREGTTDFMQSVTTIMGERASKLVATLPSRFGAEHEAVGSLPVADASDADATEEGEKSLDD